jgi:hypothetical protein
MPVFMIERQFAEELESVDAAGLKQINDEAVAGFKNTEQGASTSVWAAVGQELEGVGGLYREDCAQAAPWSSETPSAGVMPYALEPDSAERLRTMSEATVTRNDGTRHAE